VPWREAGLATAPFFLGGLAAREGVVEKAARCTALTVGDEMVEVSIARYEREIHREQIDCDIAAVSVYFCARLWMLLLLALTFPNREVRRSLLVRRFSPRDQIQT
jgi:hypothetical protein